MRISSRMESTRTCGSSNLVTILVVVLLMLVGAAVYLNRVRSERVPSQPQTVVASLRTLNSALVSYQVGYGAFAPNLKALGPPAEGQKPDAQAADLIDEVLASGTKAGYTFIYRVTEKDSQGRPKAYTIHAQPTQLGSPGKQYFFTDHSFVIRSEMNKPASASSPPLN